MAWFLLVFEQMMFIKEVLRSLLTCSITEICDKVRFWNLALVVPLFGKFLRWCRTCFIPAGTPDSDAEPDEREADGYADRLVQGIPQVLWQLLRPCCLRPLRRVSTSSGLLHSKIVGKIKMCVVQLTQNMKPLQNTNKYFNNDSQICGLYLQYI